MAKKPSKLNFFTKLNLRVNCFNLGQSCCETPNGYGCCPTENAICCGDGIHCCPQGSTCDITTATCIWPQVRQTWATIKTMYSIPMFNPCGLFLMYVKMNNSFNKNNFVLNLSFKHSRWFAFSRLRCWPNLRRDEPITSTCWPKTKNPVRMWPSAALNRKPGQNLFSTFLDFD